MWAKDVAVPGVGRVAKNTAVRTTILLRVNVYPQQKITIILFAAVKRLDSKRGTTVEAGTLGIAQEDGTNQ